MRTKLITIGCVVAVILLLLVFMLSPPSRGASSPLSVTFSGYTNDNAGERLARMTVTNRSGLALRRESHGRVEYRTGPQKISGFHVAIPVSLSSGQSEVYLVPAPTNRGMWRVAFKILRVDRRFEMVDRARQRSLLPQRLHERLYNDRIELCWSDWIDE